MDGNMKIAIIGTGAVGGYYGALLAKNGFDVHFLLNRDFGHVRQHGLLVESVDETIRLPKVNAYGRPEDMPPCDIGIVALKTTSNEKLAHILPCAVKPDGAVVVLQNGLGVERQVFEILPGATITGGLCFLCSNKTGPGHIRHLDYGSIRMGQYRADDRPAGITEELKRIAEIFGKASISVEITDDLGKARWEKLVWNMPFNGLSVLLDADTSELISSTPAQAILREIMLEVIGAARHCGYEIGDALAEKMIAATRKMVPYKPSMKLDYESGRPLEIGAIYHTPINTASRFGYRMEKSRIVSLQLEHLDPHKRLSPAP